MASQHVWEQVAEQLGQWLESEPDVIAEQLFGGGRRAPFAGKATEKEKLAYYRSQFFNDNGSPNEQGRTELLNRVGVDGYTQIYNALMSDSLSPIDSESS